MSLPLRIGSWADVEPEREGELNNPPSRSDIPEKVSSGPYGVARLYVPAEGRSDGELHELFSKPELVGNSTGSKQQLLIEPVQSKGELNFRLSTSDFLKNSCSNDSTPFRKKLQNKAMSRQEVVCDRQCHLRDTEPVEHDVCAKKKLHNKRMTRHEIQCDRQCRSEGDQGTSLDFFVGQKFESSRQNEPMTRRECVNVHALLQNQLMTDQEPGPDMTWHSEGDSVMPVDFLAISQNEPFARLERVRDSFFDQATCSSLRWPENNTVPRGELRHDRQWRSEGSTSCEIYTSSQGFSSETSSPYVSTTSSELAMYRRESGASSAFAVDAFGNPSGPPSSSGNLLSAGTCQILHDCGDCKPCLFVQTPVGCKEGSDCSFCHLRHSRSKFPRPGKGKRDRFKRYLMGE